MSKTGLRLRLPGLWALSLLACVAVALLLGQLYLQSTTARVGRAEAAWRGAAPGLSDPKLRAGLETAVNLALTGQNGVEGAAFGRRRPDRWPALSRPIREPVQRPICPRPSVIALRR